MRSQKKISARWSTVWINLKFQISNMCTAARVPSVDALSWPPRYRTTTGLNIKMSLMHLSHPVYLWPFSFEISSNFPENSKLNMLYSLMKYWTIPRAYFSRSCSIRAVRMHPRTGQRYFQPPVLGGDAVHVYSFWNFHFIFHTPYRHFRRCARRAGAYIT